MNKILSLTLLLLLNSYAKEYPNIQFSGRLALDSAFTSDANDQEIRRARAAIKGDITETLAYEAEYSFTKGGKIKDLYLKYKLKDYNSNLLFGNIKVPFGLEAMTSSKYNTFMERALPDIFIDDRKIGLRVDLNKIEKNSDALTLSFGAFTQSINNYKSSQKKYTLASRATYTAFLDKHYLVHFGTSLSYSDMDSKKLKLSARPESHLAGKYIKTKVKDVLSNTKFALEGFYQYYNSTLQGEFIFDTIKDELKQKYKLSGWYIEYSYLFTKESRTYKAKSATFSKIKPKSPFDYSKNSYGAFEGAFRISDLNLDDLHINSDKFLNYTFALNWYPTKDIKVMSNYIISDLDDKTLSTPNIFQLRVEYDF